ncbi:AlpA family phage regulatory protein [Ralstonia solanacearum species complex bacterium KE056]|uniref:helix-turn-helix transcriptional regulator n=1 Tax=Ralstonia solanacearum species complex bacterium KE056 TaxID=3119585 RepID=UPI002FC34F4B
MLNTQNAGLETYVRQRQLLGDKIVPFAGATLWRKVKDGSFPAPVKLSPGVTAWKVSDIQAWQRGEWEASRDQK